MLPKCGLPHPSRLPHSEFRVSPVSENKLVGIYHSNYSNLHKTPEAKNQFSKCRVEFQKITTIIFQISQDALKSIMGRAQMMKSFSYQHSPNSLISDPHLVFPKSCLEKWVININQINIIGNHTLKASAGFLFFLFCSGNIGSLDPETGLAVVSYVMYLDDQ